ncbi:MAG: hypothetical protein Q9178_007581 [Gyalolechia marmorata]
MGNTIAKAFTGPLPGLDYPDPRIRNGHGHPFRHGPRAGMPGMGPGMPNMAGIPNRRFVGMPAGLVHHGASGGVGRSGRQAGMAGMQDTAGMPIRPSIMRDGPVRRSAAWRDRQEGGLWALRWEGRAVEKKVIMEEVVNTPVMEKVDAKVVTEEIQRVIMVGEGLVKEEEEEEVVVVLEEEGEGIEHVGVVEMRLCRYRLPGG